jgi:hypothetical protein
MKVIKKVTFSSLPRAHKYIDRAIKLNYQCLVVPPLICGGDRWEVTVLKVEQ